MKQQFDIELAPETIQRIEKESLRRKISPSILIAIAIEYLLNTQEMQS